METTAQTQRRPGVGIGVLLVKDGRVLLGKRKNSHGHGTWALPGGHLEWNETFENCARREVEEEVGMRLKYVAFLTATNDVMQEDDKHYVTMFMLATEWDGLPQVREPEKVEAWKWFDWDLLPDTLFLPLRNLVESGYHPDGGGLGARERGVIRAAAAHMRERFSQEGSGHDFWHIYRVWKNARAIAKMEGGDLFVVELAALLHDIADHKFHGGDTTVGARAAAEYLRGRGVPERVVEQVAEIVGTISYKGGGQPEMSSLEGKIVQDADRLEALGATGIARCFQYGGSKQRQMFDPTGEDTGHSIGHFYEKLLKLKDLMNTETGRSLAQGRHAFVEEFLARFHAEWNGQEPGTVLKDAEKLVRDRIPEVIRQSGEKPKTRTAEVWEMEMLLKEKLSEEVAEYFENNEAEELADVLEVVFTLAERQGVTRDQLEFIRTRKAAERGGFREGIVLGK